MSETKQRNGTRLPGIIAGALALTVVVVFPAPGGMPPQAWLVTGVALLMAIWWITEVLPLPATALLPIVLFPLFGIATMQETTAPYGDPIIFLFLGGFVIGMGMQRWALHKRIGLHAITLMGTAPRRIVGGFMLSTALLSMWISNSATAIMMLPVALSVLALLDRSSDAHGVSRRNLGIVVLLAVAYGASIGGLATLIGTPPNALLAAYMAREHDVEIGFAQWMMLGLPLSAVMLAGAWLILMRLHPVDDRVGLDIGQAIKDEKEKLGPMTTGEIRVAFVFGLTALAWMTRPLYSSLVPGIDDTAIGIVGALALFLTRSGMPEGGQLLAWDDLRGLPWGILILFGGGLTLAGAIGSSGLATWLGEAMEAISIWPVLLVVAVTTAAMIFLTELTSNTASAATFLPIGGAIALGIGLDPIVLAAPLALAASCAFMLPVATPPNAIVFSSDRISIAQMARAGLWINFLGCAAIVGLGYPLAAWLFAK